MTITGTGIAVCWKDNSTIQIECCLFQYITL